MGCTLNKVFWKNLTETWSPFVNASFSPRKIYISTLSKQNSSHHCQIFLNLERLLTFGSNLYTKLDAKVPKETLSNIQFSYGWFSNIFLLNVNPRPSFITYMYSRYKVLWNGSESQVIPEKVQTKVTLWQPGQSQGLPFYHRHRHHQ